MTVFALLITIVVYIYWKIQQDVKIYSEWTIKDPIEDVNHVYVMVTNNKIERMLLESADETAYELEVTKVTKSRKIGRV